MSDTQPLFAKQFDWAVVRIATYAASQTSSVHLLFGSVSLLTKDRPQPAGMAGIDRCKIDKGRNGTVFFRRVVLSASEAIKWYRSVSSTDLKTPIPFALQEREAADGMSICSTDLIDDPEWPALAVPNTSEALNGHPASGHPAPFIGSVPARIHRRISQNVNFEAITNSQPTVRFLERRLHLNLAQYPEYLGGLALVVPDPFIRIIDNFVVPNEQDGSEKVVFRFTPRAGQSLHDLSMTVLEHRANLLSRLETVLIPPNGLVVLPRNLPVQQIGYVVIHPSQGILQHQHPFPFLRSIHFRAGIVGRKRVVHAPLNDSPNSPIDEYSVSEVRHDKPQIVGSEATDTALSRIWQASERRYRQAAARKYDQTWFEDGDREAALNFLRRRISRARAHIMVADPYFGARQILQFLLAVPQTEVEITILTSRLAFETGTSSQDTTSSGRAPERKTAHPNALVAVRKKLLELERLHEFTRAYTTFATSGITNTSALVLPGHPPPLHDRFLAIDNKVWFLGHSLNALGDRASLIMQAPNPDPILERLQKMKSSAIPFEKYAKSRLANPGVAKNNN